MLMAKKKTITTTINVHGREVMYTGRFLGFLKAEEYLKAIGNAQITSRIESKESKNLIRGCAKLALLLNGARFVLALSKRGEKAVSKKLLISEPLDFVCQIKPESREVSFATMKGGTIVLKEHEANEGEK
jgi:hypothetical protein